MLHDDSNPSFAPDGSRLVFSRLTWAPTAISNRLMALDLETGDLTVLTPETESWTAPSYAPDGTRIVARGAPNGEPEGIYVMDADGSDPEPVWVSETSDLPSWSPDGRRVLVQAFDWADSGRIEMWAVDTDGSNPRLVSPPDVARAGGAFSPDSSGVAYVERGSSPSAPHRIWTAQADGSDPVVVASLESAPGELDWQPLSSDGPTPTTAPAPTSTTTATAPMAVTPRYTG